jgi:predicted small integral membrane protein
MTAKENQRMKVDSIASNLGMLLEEDQALWLQACTSYFSCYCLCYYLVLYVMYRYHVWGAGKLLGLIRHTCFPGQRLFISWVTAQSWFRVWSGSLQCWPIKRLNIVYVTGLEWFAIHLAQPC